MAAPSTPPDPSEDPSIPNPWGKEDPGVDEAFKGAADAAKSAEESGYTPAKTYKFAADEGASTPSPGSPPGPDPKPKTGKPTKGKGKPRSPTPPKPSPGWTVIEDWEKINLDVDSSSRGKGKGRGKGSKTAIDVNIVSPLPLPVQITGGGGGGPGGGGGGGGGSGGSGGPNDQPGHNVFNTPNGPVRNDEPYGMTVGDSFSRMFGRGYASGYPIHNLATLGRNLGGIAKQAGSSAMDLLDAGTGGSARKVRDVSWERIKDGKVGRFIGGAANKADEAARGFGNNLGGWMEKLLGIDPSRPNNPNTPIGLGTGGGQKSSISMSGIGGAASKAKSNLFNVPGTGPQNDNTDGPIKVAATSIIKLGAAAVSAAQEVYEFARAQEDEVRRLGEFGGQQAKATAMLDVNRMMRDLHMAEVTGDSSESLLAGINRFEDALEPIQEAATNLANTVGGDLLNLIASMVEPLAGLAKTVNDFVLWWRGEEGKKKAQHATLWGDMAKLAEEHRQADQPQWPGAAQPFVPAPVTITPPSWWKQ
jgi:hypothetical protein